MKTSIYVTTAQIGEGTGGGVVAYHELEALKKVTEVLTVTEGNQIINPYINNPFMFDYFFAVKRAFLNERLEMGLPLPDIAVFNGNPFGCTVRWLRQTGNTKIVTCVPAHNLEVSREEFRRLGITFPYIHLTEPYLWNFYVDHIALANVVICPSKLSADYIIKKLTQGTNWTEFADKVFVIPHGCNLPETKPLPQKFTVTHVGVNGPDKGQIYLHHGFNLTNLPRDHLLMAGYGTEVWGGFGYVENLEETFERTWVYVQPSVTEGFGIPVLEAMAYGKPVIVTEGCGSCDLVENGKEGFVVPIRSPEEIAKKILYFYNSPEEVRRMGENARKKAEGYTWDKIEKQYIDLYLKVMR